tara:strand:- start:35 stop:319 length:285 start_codon:yes stop_codon:yes gene_type:complete
MKAKKMSPETGLKWKMIAMQAFLNCREVRDATKHVLPKEQQDIDALVSVQDWITQTEKNADDAWLAKNYQRQIDKMIAEDQARIERWKNGKGAN